MCALGPSGNLGASAEVDSASHWCCAPQSYGTPEGRARGFLTTIGMLVSDVVLSPLHPLRVSPA